MTSMSRPRRTVQSVLNDLIARTNTDTRRLRVIEQEMDILKTRMASLERGMTEYKAEVRKSISGLGSSVSKSEEGVSGMENMLKEIVKGMKRFASESKIRELEQLIEIYSPLKSNFVTREEIEGIVEDAVAKETRRAVINKRAE